MPRQRDRVCLQDGLKLDLNRLARRGFIKPGANIGLRKITWTHSYWGDVASAIVRVPPAARSDLDYSAADCVTSNQGAAEAHLEQSEPRQEREFWEETKVEIAALPQTETAPMAGLSRPSP
jgi:hypothetical protein